MRSSSVSFWVSAIKKPIPVTRRPTAVATAIAGFAPRVALKSFIAVFAPLTPSVMALIVFVTFEIVVATFQVAKAAPIPVKPTITASLLSITKSNRPLIPGNTVFLIKSKPSSIASTKPSMSTSSVSSRAESTIPLKPRCTAVETGLSFFASFAVLS